MFESPIHGIEKIFIRRTVPQKLLTSKNQNGISNVNNNNSRSTSSESVETAWLLTSPISSSIKSPVMNRIVTILVLKDGNTSIRYPNEIANFKTNFNNNER